MLFIIPDDTTIKNQKRNVKAKTEISPQTLKTSISVILILIGIVLILYQVIPLIKSFAYGLILQYKNERIQEATAPVSKNFLQKLLTDTYYDPGPQYFEKLTNSVHIENVKIDTKYKKEMKISIPSVGINNVTLTPNVPSSPKSVYEKALKKGVAHLKNTPLPGDGGNPIIYGHSGISKLLSKNSPRLTFTKLEDAEIGDKIYIKRDGKTLTYTISQKKIVSPDDVSFISNTNSSNEEIILITCWPIGIGTKRLVLIGSKN